MFRQPSMLLQAVSIPESTTVQIIVKEFIKYFCKLMKLNKKTASRMRVAPPIAIQDPRSKDFPKIRPRFPQVVTK